jgi:serine/threonine protein kinase
MEVAESVLRAGYRLDRYELLCPIASGGMATVWLARLRGKRGFEKLFAVKTIRTELVDDPRFEEMFLDEARIASGIQHPNVAQILDLGEQDAVLFIVMEWVDGDSLAKIRKLLAKRETRLPVGIVLRVLADACAGLHAAHELRGDGGEPLDIVHRDVSPHNILVAQNGAVKVIDFGIAKAQNRRQGETRTGIVKGKVQYMAPEQVKKGGIADRRTDVWALGVCLHELVAGAMPYGGEDDLGVIRKLMNDEAPAIEQGLPQPITRVLERSLALEPDGRFPTAAGMQRALEGAMKELGEAVSSEDVAGFVRSELPDLARKRRDAVTKAVSDARDRGAIEGGSGSGEDVAFAPTMVGERDASEREEARAIVLTKRKGSPVSPLAPAEEPVSSPENSRVTPFAALEQEPITIPKRSRVWLWGGILLVAGVVGASAAWPAAASRMLSALGWAGATGPALSEPDVRGTTRAATEATARPGASTLAGATEKAGAPPGAASETTGKSAETPQLPNARPAMGAAQLHTPSVQSQAVPNAPSADASNVQGFVEGAAPSAVPATVPEEDPNNPYNN